MNIVAGSNTWMEQVQVVGIQSKKRASVLLVFSYIKARPFHSSSIKKKNENIQKNLLSSCVLINF
jgi:hypothetical protein